MDIEKTVQFLLEQQARLEARQAGFIERFAEVIECFDKSMTQSAERIAEIENLLAEVATSQTKTSAVLATLAERHVEMEESQKVTEQNLNAFQRSTEQNIRALSVAQKTTQQNLNALTANIERHIANHN
ncbi:MAG: hypothetical protein WAV20_06930 [Blastocatellia bacterium]